MKLLESSQQNYSKNQAISRASLLEGINGDKYF